MGKKITAPPVQIGSVWADNSIRGHGRSVQVRQIEHGYAICVTITNSHGVQRDLDNAAECGWPHNVRDMRGSICRIRLDRFRPTLTGYAHVTDTPQVTDEALAAVLTDADPHLIHHPEGTSQ